MSEVHKFTHPDHSDNPRFFIEFLEITDRLPQVPDIRARSFCQMRVQPGTKVLDVGCGLGTAVLEMADHLGPAGSACGVDISEVMVAEATSRAAGRANVEFRMGGACELPFPDASFDAIRCERVFLYVPDRAKALAEMRRVTKPGGRVVITDVDIDCTAIFSQNPRLTRKLVSLVAEAFPHPTSARELPALLRAAGFEDVTPEFLALESPYEFCLHAMHGTLRAAADAGKVTHAEIDEWYSGLSALNDAGDFLQLWFFAIVGGTV